MRAPEYCAIACDAYRVGAGAAADGADARVSVTTGYFAHAVIPTADTISASTSNADFSLRYMRGPPVSRPRPVRVPTKGVHPQCRSQKLLPLRELAALQSVRV